MLLNTETAAACGLGRTMLKLAAITLLPVLLIGFEALVIAAVDRLRAAVRGQE
jgi:hypothetical protein